MGQKQPHAIDENLITIAPGQTASDGSAVLAAVKQREIELKTELLKTRQAADEILAKARSEAAAIKAKAASSGQKKGTAVADKEVNAAKKQAAEVAAEATEAVKGLAAKGRRNFDKAVTFVLESVLPRSGKEASNVLEDGQS